MKRFVFLILMFALIYLPLLTFSQTINLLDQSVRNAIDDLVEDAIADNNLPGIAVGIVYDGKIAFTQGYGASEIGTSNMTANTVLRWGSISKTVTGVLAMKLVENGDIDLDDPVTDHVPEYDYSNVTIRHLLAHQSGTRHYNEGCSFSPYYSGAFDADESLEIVEQCNLLFTPGTNTNYSTFGVTLLGVVIDRVGEDVYGKGYEELFEDWIKDELGLSSMEADDDNNNPAMATGYSSAGNATTNIPDLGWRLPAGGFASNIYHLSRYMLGLMNFEFINSTTSNTMWTPQTLNNGTATGFGLGVIIDQSTGDLGVWHNGRSDNMSNTLMDFFPNQNLGIVIMTNAGWGINTVFPIIRDMKEDILDVVRCPSSRVFKDAIFLSVDMHYEASDFIEVSNTHFSNANIVLDAGNKVTLKAGTYIPAGSKFKATIDGCSTNTPPMRVASDPTVKGSSTIVTSEIEESFSEQLRIMPNPFRNVVKVVYTVEEAAIVHLTLYDMHGKAIGKPIANEQKQPGTYAVEFNSSALPEGMYLYHLQIGTETVKGKLIKTQ